MRIAHLLSPLIVLMSVHAQAAEWPQFRGPTGQGHAEARNLPVRWSDSEHVTWKTAIPGTGWSSPVIDGPQIWMTTALDDGRSLRAVCVNRDSGKIIRNVEVFRIAQPDAINPKNSYASPTPVLDRGRLYVHFGTFGTACVNADTGEVVWRNQELKLDHKEGPGSSPVLWRDLLIVTCDGLDAQFVAAFQKDTGRVAWKTPRSGATNPNPDFRKTYGTPLVISVDGQDALVSPGADRLYGYDPATGKELWRVDYQGFSNVPRPLFAHGLLYVCTGFPRPQIWAVRPGGHGDVTATHVTWQFTREAPKNPSPIIVGGELYMVSDRGVLTCLDALTGEQRWIERLGGNYSASPVYADGRLYFCSEEGQTFVLAPGKEFKLLATNQLDGRLMASPAAADNALFLRTDTHLYRIEQPRKTTTASANTSRDTVRVAGIVLKWLRGDKQANYLRASALIREAAGTGAKIVCTTECFLDGYAIADKSIPLEEYRALGETIPTGPYYRQLAALADELDIHLIAGMLETDGEARHNTVVLIGPDGGLVGKYRKQKLQHELVRNTPGTSSSVFETPHGQVGLMICADRTDAGIVRRFSENGADFLICPSGGMFGPKSNDPIVQARSQENGKYIVFVHPAEFLVTAPDGSIVSRELLGDTLLIAREQIGGPADQNRVYYFDLPGCLGSP